MTFQEINMQITNYLELKDHFEEQLKDNFQFELLELHYLPYSFGSGMTAYRIKGKIFKIIFDGKDNLVECMVSASHDNYIRATWTTIFTGSPIDFIDKGTIELKNIFRDKQTKG